MKLDIDKIGKMYGIVLKENGDRQCTDIDQCFHAMDVASMGEYEEETKECALCLDTNDDVEELVTSISDIILCGRLMEQLLDENKFTDDPDMNQKIVARINQFIEERGL